MSALPYAGGAVFVLMLAQWIASLPLKDASIVDRFWGAGFVLVAACTAYVTAPPTPRGWIVLAVVTVWGLRLSAYLTWRNWGEGEDRRYQKMRAHWGARFGVVSLFTVFLFQGAVMLVIATPVMVAIAARDTSLGALDVGAGVTFLIGFTFEAVGDLQLARFLASPSTDGQVMDRGLWRYTRHPNYFGDALAWWGIATLAFATGAWWTAFAPAIMTFLLLKVSGVVLLEKTIVKRRPAYEDHARRTSAFIPWPPRETQPR
ncbi:MAG: DUF1295 domain-containing protein [Deltaproteobacteria bacterium]